MILAIWSANLAEARAAARSLTESGFQILDLDDNPGRPEQLEEIQQAFGPAVRARLVTQDIDPLLNLAVCGLHNHHEVTALQCAGPVAVLSLEHFPFALPVSIPVETAAGNGAEPGRSVLDAVRRLSARIPRISWDTYFMLICRQIAARSDCVKRHVAAIIVKDRRLISTGYNGTPRGVQNCSQGGCPRCSTFGPSGAALGECLCSHGEENAITQAAYHGISVKDAVLYTTTSPCLLCTKMIINAGISQVVYDAAYPLGEKPLRLLQEAGVRVVKYERQEEPCRQI